MACFENRCQSSQSFVEPKGNLKIHRLAPRIGLGCLEQVSERNAQVLLCQRNESPKLLRAWYVWVLRRGKSDLRTSEKHRTESTYNYIDFFSNLIIELSIVVCVAGFIIHFVRRLLFRFLALHVWTDHHAACRSFCRARMSQFFLGRHKYVGDLVFFTEPRQMGDNIYRTDIRSKN